MPPAAITGTETASATCGTSASVPTPASSAVTSKAPRWPPASQPWAMIASTPARFERPRLGDRRRGRHHPRPRGAQPRHRVASGQAEMEAHHRRRVGEERREVLLRRRPPAPAPAAPAAPRGPSRHRTAPAAPAPGRRASASAATAPWAKKLRLNAPVGPPPHLAADRADLRRVEPGAAERAEPAGVADRGGELGRRRSPSSAPGRSGARCRGARSGAGRARRDRWAIPVTPWSGSRRRRPP